MNPTPTFTQLAAEPAPMNCWWLFPVLLAIVFAFWYVQRWLNQRAIKAALDEVREKAYDERARIDEQMFAHLPSDASEYRRARMALHIACVQYERPDLIVSNPKEKVTS